MTSSTPGFPAPVDSAEPRSAGPDSAQRISVGPALPAGSARRAVLNQLRPGRRGGVALAAGVAAATLLPLAAPQFTGRFVNDAVGGASVRVLVLTAFGYLATAVAGQAARMLTAWLANRLAWDGTNRLRERLAEHALRLDLAFHARHTPGEMIERVDGDVAAVAAFVVAFLLDVVASALLLAGMLVVVCCVDPLLGGVLAAYYALVALAMGRAQRRAVPYEAAARESSAVLFGQLEERLAGAEDIRANGAGRHVVRRFGQVSDAWYEAEHRAAWTGSGLIAATSVAFALGTAIMLGLAAWAERSGRLTVGTTVLLFQYTLMVRTPFERLFDQLRQYQAALAGAARIGGLLAERRTLPVPVDPRPLPETGPLGLCLDGLGFAYADDGEPVLTDINLTLEPGETLGLVGRTGGGKTTIARMLLRLYDPTEGAVRVAGLDLREVDPASLRRRICVVTQDVQLFAASVRDNLTLFRPLADDARLRAVLAEVGLGDWLAALPDGLDSPVGGGTGSIDTGSATAGSATAGSIGAGSATAGTATAGGIGAGSIGAMSAGEAQLLALARAFLADPGLVVLDEASSRLDPATERSVERSVDRLLAGRTGVLIAHRLSSLDRVDKIAVVGDGRLVEYGRRADLAADPDSRFSRLLAAAGAGAAR